MEQFLLSCLLLSILLQCHKFFANLIFIICFLGRAGSTGLQLWLCSVLFGVRCSVSVRIYKCKLRQPEQGHVTVVAVKTSLFVYR